MLTTRSLSKNLTTAMRQSYKLARRNYGLPASAIGLGTDPRKDNYYVSSVIWTLWILL